MSISLRNLIPLLLSFVTNVINVIACYSIGLASIHLNLPPVLEKKFYKEKISFTHFLKISNQWPHSFLNNCNFVHGDSMQMQK